MSKDKSKRKAHKPTATAIAYYRVSTQRQGQSGLGLEAQRMTVTRYCRDARLQIVAEYTEIETGTRKRHRPILDEAIERARRDGAVLIIAKLDRLARNVKFISTLMEGNVPFVTVDFPNMTPLVLHVLAAVAEEEARMISARTKAALAAAKARGVKLGAPEHLTKDAYAKAHKANLDKAVTAYKPLTNYIHTMRDDGMTLRDIAKQLNADGSRTRRGSLFTAATVARILKRAAAPKNTETTPDTATAANVKIQRQTINHTAR